MSTQLNWSALGYGNGELKMSIVSQRGHDSTTTTRQLLAEAKQASLFGQLWQFSHLRNCLALLLSFWCLQGVSCHYLCVLEEEVPKPHGTGRNKVM